MNWRITVFETVSPDKLINITIDKINVTEKSETCFPGGLSTGMLEAL